MIEIRLLLVLNSPPGSSYGGGQVYANNLIDGLKACGIALSVAFPKSSGEANNTPASLQSYPFNLDLARQEIESIILESNCNIIHAHAYKAEFCEAARKLNIPIFVTVHHGGILCPSGALMNYKDEICKIPANKDVCLKCVVHQQKTGKLFYPFWRKIGNSKRGSIGKAISKLPFFYFLTPLLQTQWSVNKKLEEWQKIIANVNLLIAPSDAAAHSVIINGCPPEKVKVIPHGTELEVANHSKYRNPSILQFGYIGRISYVKGLHILLEAMQGVSKPWKLIIVGEAATGAELNYKKQLISRYKSDSRIVWTGDTARNQIPWLLDQMDFLVHPTICLEIYGLNIAEALSRNVPVIATKCGGAEMMIKHDVNGILVEPNNVKSLTEGIEAAIQKQDFSHFTDSVVPFDRHVAQLIKEYSNLLPCASLPFQKK